MLCQNMSGNAKPLLALRCCHRNLLVRGVLTLGQYGMAFPCNLQPNEIANCKTRRLGEASDTAKETNNRRFACGDERKNDYFTKVAKVVVARVQENGRKKLKPAKKCRVSSLSHLAFHIPPLPGRTDARFVRDGLSG